MRLSAKGRELIKSFEGLSLTAYKDADGYSIGYGHFGAQPGQTISRAEADRLFDADVARFELAVSLTTPNATQDQFDAMVSLAYNIGTGPKGFGGSTLARLHNAGDYAAAADQFTVWRKSQGHINPVLVERRRKERAVYKYGFDPFSALPVPARYDEDDPIASTPGAPASSASSRGGKVIMIALFVGVGALIRALWKA